MKIRELQSLLDEQPSVSGNTFFVGTLHVLAWLLSAVFLVLGIGLLAEGLFHYKIFLDWVARSFKIILNDDQRAAISKSFGLLSLLLSFIFGAVIVITKMILKRNHFIIKTEEWIYSNIPEINTIPLRKPVKK